MAVNHLHSIDKLAHLDLKPENLVLNENGILSLIDFGLSEAIDEILPNNDSRGTINFMAPEMLNGKTKNLTAIDVFGVGVLLFTIIYRAKPFPGGSCLDDENYIQHFIMSDKYFKFFDAFEARNPNVSFKAKVLIV